MTLRGVVAGIALAFVLAPGAMAGDGFGGGLPLRHGEYVADVAACRSPPFAEMQSYDGRGLGGPHSHGCRLQVLGRRGAVMRVRQTCIDAGEGPAPRVATTLVLRLEGPQRYAELTPGRAPRRFRWCPAEAVLKGR